MIEINNEWEQYVTQAELLVFASSVKSIYGATYALDGMNPSGTPFDGLTNLKHVIFEEGFRFTYSGVHTIIKNCNITSVYVSSGVGDLYGFDYVFGGEYTIPNFFDCTITKIYFKSETVTQKRHNKNILLSRSSKR